MVNLEPEETGRDIWLLSQSDLWKLKIKVVRHWGHALHEALYPTPGSEPQYYKSTKNVFRISAFI